MRGLRIAGGIVLVLMGLLWSLQGADLVHIKPVLCFANCEPLVGGSVAWLAAGLVAAAAGVLLVWRGGATGRVAQVPDPSSPMRTYELSVVIAAEAPDVWQVMADVTRWPEWLPTVTRVSPLDGAPLTPGSRFVVHQPGLRPTVWKVTEVEAPRRFAWEARSLGLHMIADHAVTRRSPGSSGVLLRFSFGGPLGGLVGRLMRSLTERYLAQEAAALKARAEPRKAPVRNRFAYVAVMLGAVSAPTLAAQAPPPDPVGTWRGTSLCQVRPSACKDEQVVYRITGTATRDSLALDGRKVVNGAEVEMGVLGCRFDRPKAVLTCPIPEALWQFTVRGDSLVGELRLADGTRVREVRTGRSRQGR